LGEEANWAIQSFKKTQNNEKINYCNALVALV
jgi:hypothetical protein